MSFEPLTLKRREVLVRKTEAPRVEGGNALRVVDVRVVRDRHLARVAVVRESVVTVAIGDVVLDHMVEALTGELAC
ncbi:hypothetical protein HEP84_00145 [Streptomyces sp. RLB1-33]|nr:hypothetical protein [Streptomyces sp. RLB1-33]QIY67983.1 hypothetical protein HEP84_00145 [Streptomyces sp. RLB1-33]